MLVFTKNIQLIRKHRLLDNATDKQVVFNNKSGFNNKDYSYQTQIKQKITGKMLKGVYHQLDVNGTRSNLCCIVLYTLEILSTLFMQRIQKLILRWYKCLKNDIKNILKTFSDKMDKKLEFLKEAQNLYNVVKLELRFLTVFRKTFQGDSIQCRTPGLDICDILITSLEAFVSNIREQSDYKLNWYEERS